MNTFPFPHSLGMREFLGNEGRETGVTRPRPDGGLKKTGITRPRPDGGVTRKAPGALDPAVVLHPPGGVKYVTVTQNKGTWLCSERNDEYFFGRAKTGGLGQVTTEKKTTEKKGYY